MNSSAWKTDVAEILAIRESLRETWVFFHLEIESNCEVMVHVYLQVIWWF